MTGIHLLAVEASRASLAGLTGSVPLLLLDELAAALASAFQVSCHVRPEPLDAGFAFEPVRSQFYSTAILQRMQSLPRPAGVRLLGVTGLDLYVPVLTFVFGEAQVEGDCALVSLHRLREEFYGLPAREDLLHERLTKEAAHELGHTLGLRHCDDWECVMASTHAVERMDVKSAQFCRACRRRIMTERVPAGG